MKEVLKMVVFEYKACDISYFLDTMQEYELSIILEYLPYTFKQEWEQSRLISYVIAQTQSTKQLKPTDLLKFSWDDIKKEDTTLTKKDVERLKHKMDSIIESNKKTQK